jgi:hypothetical protein
MDFFAPTGLLAGGGWIIQNNAPGKGSQRASGIGASGDEVAKALYDVRETLTETYKLFSGEGTLPALGTVVSGWHIDSVRVSLSATDWPSMTITAHKHTDGVGHADMKTYTASITAPAAAWGVPAAPFGITVGTLNTVGVSSAEYNFSVTHVDELAAGKQIGAQNRDAVEKLSVTYVGTTTPTGPDGWDEMETGTNASNEAASGGSASWEHHVAADAGA